MTGDEASDAQWFGDADWPQVRRLAQPTATLRAYGLGAALAANFAPNDASALAACHDTIIAVGDALLDRSELDGTIRCNVDIRDLLRLVNAIASASQQVPGDARLADRLLAIALGSTSRTSNE